MKLIVYSCAHGRLSTVKRCIRLSPEVERIMVYSNETDGAYLKSLGVEHLYKFPNQPLSDKWNHGLKKLKNIDFDHVIMMGSDDYFDDRFLDYVKKHAPNYDMLGFSDMYFMNEAGERYYWGGYKNERIGEPAGAGKVYSKEFLEKIGYDLFPVKRPRGLDGQSWVIVNHYNAKIKISSLKDNGLWLCDVKDGKGITPIHTIKGLVRV